MSKQDNSIEIQAEDVDSAIVEGLRQLGLRRDEVTIEVVEEGRRGFLGLGGREAIVRLTPNRAAPKDAISADTPIQASRETASPVAEGSETNTTVPTMQSESDVATVEAAPPATSAPQSSEAAEQALVALNIVSDLLAYMHIDASIETRYTEPDDETGRQMLVLEIQGEKLGDLIGARGESLNDFQYVARLMAGQRLHRRPDFLIDVDGYRARREQALTQLAKRMAEKAVKRGRPVTLEPMSPYDRRVVHIALRDDHSVHTESTGQGSRRRVRIFPN